MRRLLTANVGDDDGWVQHACEGADSDDETAKGHGQRHSSVAAMEKCRNSDYRSAICARRNKWSREGGFRCF